MRKLNLQGCLDIMSGLVGTLTNDDGIKQSVIIALLPDSLPKKKLAEEKARIRTEAEKHFLSLHGLETERLSNLFDRLAQPQSTLEVRGGQPAGPMLDFLLEDEAAKNVIFCHDKKAYLEVCSELGISRNELLNIAELSSLLPQETKKEKPAKLVGHARHLCRELAAGNVPIITNTGRLYRFLLNKKKADHYIKEIARAGKYDLGFLEETQEFPVSDDHSKHYLPHDPSYFEFTTVVGGEKKCIYLLCEKGDRYSTDLNEVQKLGSPDEILTSIFVEDNNMLYLFPLQLIVRSDFSINSFLPFNSVNLKDAAAFLDQGLLMQANPSHQPILTTTNIVLAALDIINEPRYQPILTTEALTTKQKKIEKKERRKNPTVARTLPLFSYHTVNFNAQSQPSAMSSGRSVSAESGKNGGCVQGLWKQPFHKRKEHRRTVHYGDGTSEKRVIAEYNAGNPEVGIISKTGKLQLM